MGTAHLHLAEYLSEQNRNSEAEANFSAAIRFIGEHANAFPDVGYYQGLLAKCSLSHGKMLLAANRVNEARLSFKKALVVVESLLSVSDETSEYPHLAEEAKFHLTEMDRKEAGTP